MLACRGGRQDGPRMQKVRQAHIHYLAIGIINRLFKPGKKPWDTVLTGKGLRALLRPRKNRHNLRLRNKTMIRFNVYIRYKSGSE